MREKPTCCVVDPDCEAAANWEDAELPNRICVCLTCGMPVCKMCSSIRQDRYGSHGKIRMCHNCQEDLDGNRRRIEAKIRKRAKF